MIVPAAGSGRRFGSAIPKQYLPLLGQTVMQCTLDRLGALNQISKIVVPVNASDQLAASLQYQYRHKLAFVAGGAERADSVLAGLEALKGQASDEDWVLVHDVARPCVRLSDIERLMAELATHAVGGILANPVRDTIKQSAVASPEIVATVLRSQLWQALTPQMFRFGLLYQALVQAGQQQALVTDEASALELLGYQPRLVAGAHDNLKITYPEDLALAEYLLRQQA
jgi:2-C-methyl-D-erythritol 4-phosphate cytidylyltransferase